MRSIVLKTVTAILLAGTYGVSHAAPLTSSTTLNLQSGGSPDGTTGMCTVGTCFGMEVSPTFWIWTMVDPGRDGGFVIDKNQLSGGQEAAPSGTNATTGDLSAAWFFFGAYGTFYADNALNTFSDTSNDGTTMLNDFNVAWNGNVIDMAGALAQSSMNDYTITLDGVGGGSWSMDYTAVVPDGAFIGVPFRLIARGSVSEVFCSCGGEPPVVNDVSIAGESGTVIYWAPDFTDDAGDVHTCEITANALNGYATVNPDCSGGTYTSGAGYFGLDSFNYTVTDQEGLSATGTVTVEVYDQCGGVVACTPVCLDDYPLRIVTTIGGGQSPTVNASLQTTFTGHIVTEAGLVTGGKNTVKICPGTTVDFESTSTLGAASCNINSAATASSGTLAIGDKMICTNKPDGSDVDRFSIKSGL